MDLETLQSVRWHSRDKFMAVCCAQLRLSWSDCSMQLTVERSVSELQIKYVYSRHLQHWYKHTALLSHAGAEHAG